MTPTEVRDRLGAIGFDLSKYSSALSAIHTVLKRLSEAGEIQFVELDSGKFAYEWRPGTNHLSTPPTATRQARRAGKERGQ